MNKITRGVRNAFRNSIRTFSIVLILGLSIGLALAMTVARASVQDKITSVKSSVGNTIAITPAGSRDFMGGGEPLTTEQLAAISSMDHVVSVTESLSDRLTTDTSDLESAIEAGSLGNRNAGTSGVDFQQAPPEGGMMQGGSTQSSDGTTQITRTFTPPVTVTGVNSLANASVYGGDTVTFTSGVAIDPSSNENVAMVGAALAEKNSLVAGSTFTAYGETITVVGVYDTGNTFSNNGVIFPIATLQRLSDQAGSVTSATVTVDSVENIDAVVTSLKSSLGDTADVTSNQDNADQIVEPLESVKTIASYSLVASVIAGAIIILLTMVMIVRERRREIGVLKAIGASNGTVITQFITEAITLTVLGLVVGIVIGVAAANPLTQALVTNSTSSATTQQGGPGGNQVRGGGPGGAVRSFGSNALSNARDVQASVGWEMLGYGFILALFMAVLGSAIPAYAISKVRPAEVMRAE